MVSEPRFLISAFLEDVLNEITTFAAPEGAQGGPKSLQSIPARVRNELQTPLDWRIDFWVFLRALAGAEARRGRRRVHARESEVTLRKTAIFRQNPANRLRGKQIPKK